MLNVIHSVQILKESHLAWRKSYNQVFKSRPGGLGVVLCWFSGSQTGFLPQKQAVDGWMKLDFSFHDHFMVPVKLI